MPTDKRSEIESALKSFVSGDLTKNSLVFFETLGYTTDRRAPLDKPSFIQFKESYISVDSRFNEEKAQVREWKYVDLLFQLSANELIKTTDMFDSKAVVIKDDGNKIAIESYLFFIVELEGHNYSRTQLSHITREINRLFPMPVMILFKYGSFLTLAVIDRRLHKQDVSKDVLEKVTLIKDINIGKPHRAHIEILFDLSFEELKENSKEPIINFIALHNTWRKTLNISELNKKFYRQIADWYFWAVKSVDFRLAPGIKTEEENNSINVIRLLTRLIFVWFLKEKNLVPDDLFDMAKLSKVLKDFDPSSQKKSNYYRAILQNLFFGTLNQKMNSIKEANNRRFRSDARDSKNRADDYNVTNVYRYKDQFCNPKDALELFAAIPFLNGGLFDCLDRQDEKDPKKVVRIDGFSDNPKYQSSAPDVLFFGDEDDIDLSKIYDDKKKNHEKVKGLIHILNDYKFTIAENTPIEEEIALDPELLGRIFENLLAAYNPETGTTARKATGSFYTPREIVNHMVDESLIAYLKTKMLQENPAVLELGSEQTDAFGNKARKDQLRLERPVEINRWSDKPENLEKELRILLSYSEAQVSFDEEDKDRLITAINNLKVLDPACGSGAFPMGVLLKVVHVLHKLDPANNKWKQKQIDVAEQIPDSSIRENTLSSIEEAFSEENNYSDYSRKIYLIEKCIYGVDIQPIAVQIAKLRFFVSLLVDQHGNEKKDNRGILSLPNLETKLVAANTLIPLDVNGQHVIKPIELYPLEEQLKKTRHNYFNAKSRLEKIRYIETDKKLRREIAAILVKSTGLPKNTADDLANWDPYDQNSHAAFFDPEWMFSLTQGFNITIGNPPYVRADSGPEHLKLRKAIQETGAYDTLWEKWDLFIPFIERSYKLLDPRGVSTLIVSDAYCHSKYAQKSQEWFLEHSKIVRLDFFSKIQIFDAAVHNITYLFQKEDGKRNKPIRIEHSIEFGNTRLLETDEQRNLTYRVFFPDDTQQNELSIHTFPIEEICYISVGMVIHADEKMAPGAFLTEDLLSDRKDDKHPKRFVEGKDLHKWILPTHKYLEWGTKRAPALFRRKTFNELYEHDEKIMLPMVGDIRAAIDINRSFCNHGIFVCVPWHYLVGVRNKSLKKVTRYRNEKPIRLDLPKREELEKTSKRFNIRYLLGILNSNTACNILRANRRNNIQLYPEDWKQLPIPDVSEKEQSSIVGLVNQILAGKKKNSLADTSLLEQEIDVLVYKLYGLTEEGIKIVKGKEY